MIQSKEDAARAIKEVCEWIKTQPTHPWDDMGGKRYSHFKHEHQQECDDIGDIRGWADDLLEAANADGQYGCRLCQA